METWAVIHNTHTSTITGVTMSPNLVVLAVFEILLVSSSTPSFAQVVDRNAGKAVTPKRKS